jgi:hypothetical protein
MLHVTEDMNLSEREAQRDGGVTEQQSTKCIEDVRHESTHSTIFGVHVTKSPLDGRLHVHPYYGDVAFRVGTVLSPCPPAVYL